jgi:hypothetical protein
MAYVNPDFKTKKELKEAVKAGRRVGVYSPGPFGCVLDGKECVEGPHYPRAHTWWAMVQVVEGFVVKVLS